MEVLVGKSSINGGDWLRTEPTPLFFGEFIQSVSWQASWPSWDPENPLIRLRQNVLSTLQVCELHLRSVEKVWQNLQSYPNIRFTAGEKWLTALWGLLSALYWQPHSLLWPSDSNQLFLGASVFKRWSGALIPGGSFFWLWVISEL